MRRVFRTMGTVASVVVAAGSAAAGPGSDAGIDAAIGPAIDAAIAELERIEDRFSSYRPGSEVSRLDRGALDVADVSPELRGVLDACAWLEQVSDGAFTTTPPRGPRRIDVAGYVKGWAVERAGAVLRAHGQTNWCLDVGGDVRTSGRPARERPWRVAVRNPCRPLSVVAVLDASDLAVATSGTYERGEHLWDSRPAATTAPRVLSFTVVGPDLAWVDAFATAGWVMGLAGLDWVASFDGYAAMAVLPDGTRPATPSLLPLLAPSGRALGDSPPTGPRSRDGAPPS